VLLDAGQDNGADHKARRPKDEVIAKAARFAVVVGDGANVLMCGSDLPSLVER
jgi:hypothetical protein